MANRSGWRNQADISFLRKHQLCDRRNGAAASARSHHRFRGAKYPRLSWLSRWHRRAVGVVLEPESAYRLLDVPMDLLRNRTPEGEELFAVKAKQCLEGCLSLCG